MELTINILSNSDIKSAQKALNTLKLKSFVKVSRMAINKTLMTLRSEANAIAREKRALKKGEINRDFFKLTKARGGRMSKSNALEAKFEISGRPMSLIRFVVGSKTPRPQKGISIKARRKITVQVTPGNKIKLPKAFIAKGRNNNFQLFSRQGKKSLPLRKLAVVPLSRVFDNAEVQTRLDSVIRESLEKEMEVALNYELLTLQKESGLK